MPPKDWPAERDVPVVDAIQGEFGAWGAFSDLWVDAYSEPGQPPDPSNFASKRGRMERIQPAQVIEKVEKALALAASRRPRHD